MTEDLFKDFEAGLDSKVDEANKDDAGNTDFYLKEQEWRRKRVGKITSSNLDKLLNFDKSGHISTKTAQDYLLQVKWEQETGCEAEPVTAKTMEWGKQFEDEALFYYRKTTGIDMLSAINDFDHILFVDNIIEGFGDSPDGSTPDMKGRIEIKCPFTGAAHLRNLSLDSYHDKCTYFNQMMGHFIDPMVEWIDFVSYDPRYPEDHPNKIKIIRMERSDYTGRIAFVHEKLEWLTKLVRENDVKTILESL